jgi:hypothetical protein
LSPKKSPNLGDRNFLNQPNIQNICNIQLEM